MQEGGKGSESPAWRADLPGAPTPRNDRKDEAPRPDGDGAETGAEQASPISADAPPAAAAPAAGSSAPAGVFPVGVLAGLLVAALAYVLAMAEAGTAGRLLAGAGPYGAATGTKLAASIDDVVWLMPFLCGPPADKLRYGAVYLVLFLAETCGCTCATALFAKLVEMVLPASAAAAGWDVPCVMQVLGGMLLAAFGSKLLYDARFGDDEEAGDEGEGAVPSNFVDGAKQLVVIGILGSLDDLVLQASVLSSGALAFRHMLGGVFLGCCIVILLCWGASRLAFVVKAVEAVPLWGVVLCLSAYTFAGVLFF